MPKEPRGRQRETQNGSHPSGGEEASSAKQAAMEGDWMSTSRSKRAGGKRLAKHPAPNQKPIRISLNKNEENKPSRRRGQAARAQMATHSVEEGAVGPELSITR